MFINFPIIQADFGQRRENAALQYGTIEDLVAFRRFRKAQSNHWLSQWS